MTEVGMRQREVAASYQAKDANFNPAIEGGKNRSRMQALQNMNNESGQVQVVLVSNSTMGNIN